MNFEKRWMETRFLFLFDLLERYLCFVFSKITFLDEISKGSNSIDFKNNFAVIKHAYYLLFIRLCIFIPLYTNCLYLDNMFLMYTIFFLLWTNMLFVDFFMWTLFFSVEDVVPKITNIKIFYIFTIQIR